MIIVAIGLSMAFLIAMVGLEWASRRRPQALRLEMERLDKELTMVPCTWRLGDENDHPTGDFEPKCPGCSGSGWVVDRECSE